MSMTTVIKAHSRPSLKKLQRSVIPRVAIKWFQLGIELLEEGQEGQLKIIKANTENDAKECCLEMFDYWLNKSPDANWYQIVEALKSPAVDLTVVANDIESTFVSDEQLSQDNNGASTKKMLENTSVNNPEDNEVNFAEFTNVTKAFFHLLYILQLRLSMSEKEFYSIRNICLFNIADKIMRKLIITAQNIHQLFEVFAQNRPYCNWIEVQLLEAVATGRPKLLTLINKYQKVVYSKPLRDVWNDIPHYLIRNKYYTELKAEFDEDPDNMTVEQLLKRKPKMAKDIVAHLMEVQKGSLVIKWIVQTNKVYQAYLSFLMIPQQSRSDRFLQIGTWVVYLPQAILLDLKKVYPMISTSTLLIGYYHGVLMREINADVLLQRMAAYKMLSTSDQELISTGHSLHQKNNLLLGCVQHMSTQTLLAFCELVQELWPAVGTQLVEALQPMDNTSPATDTSTDDHKLPDFTTSSVLVIFLHLSNDISKLLQSYDLKNLIKQFEGLMASDAHNIKLFTDNEIDNLSKVNNSVSLLRYTSTWSDHSVTKSLISSCSEDVKLLDEFDFKLDLSQSVASYPIPPFSSDMIPPDTSTHTVLAIRYDQELYKCTLQCVYDIRSLIIEKCDITQHCLQLLAVRSSPTIFYWTLPKCVVSLVSSKVQEHSDCLYHNDILEVLVYSESLLETGNDAIIGSLAFTVESKSIIIHDEEREAKLLHHSDLETNLQLKEAAEKKYETLHTQLTEQHQTLSEEIQSIQRDLQMKTEELQRREQECTQLRNKNESLQLDFQQMREELSTTGKSLEQTLESLKKHRQEDESMNSTIVDLQNQIQQLYAAKSDLEQQLQNTGGEKGQLLHQLQEIQQEKDRVMKQFDEHVAVSNETNAMLNHNLEVSQKETADLRTEKETIIDHNQRLSNKLQETTQELNEAMSELSKSVQDLESAGNRSKMLEVQLRKINGYYTQVNQEKNQLQGVLEEKIRELRENNDMLEILKNQIKKMQATLKDKDAEIDSLQDLVVKSATTRLKTGPDLNTSVGGDSHPGTYYTQVDQEKNQLQGVLEEKMRELREKNDMLEIFKNQIKRMQATLKDKDAEIDSLQDLVVKNATTRLKTGPDLNTSVGGDSHPGTGHREHRLGSGGSDTGGSHWSGIEPGRWSGNKEGQGSYNTQASNASFEHELTTTYRPHPGPQRMDQTMGHPNDHLKTHSRKHHFDSGFDSDINSGKHWSGKIEDKGQFSSQASHASLGPFNPGVFKPPPQQLLPSQPPRSPSRTQPSSSSNTSDNTPQVVPSHPVMKPHHMHLLNVISHLPQPEFSTVSGTSVKEEVPACPLCGRQFSTEDELVQHVAQCC